MILETMITVICGGLIVLIREQNKILNKLADNVAYCPTNQRNKKMIKGDA